MVQKMPRKLAEAVARYGFGMVEMFHESFYGQGIYFTSSLDYSDLYTDSSPDLVYLVSMVAPGNTYPVTEIPGSTTFLERKGNVPGYQSHYTLVNGQGKAAGLVIDPSEFGNEVDDELVIFDPSFALPLFIVEAKKEATTQPVTPFCPRAEWCLSFQAIDSGLLFSFLFVSLFKRKKERETRKMLMKKPEKTKRKRIKK